MKKLMAAFVLVTLVVFAAPAFAANPFMDVPAGHWAYDAVSHLASRGVIAGYPDGSYKGAQPATRYEMAAIVARAMAYFDGGNLSARDIELLKRLVLEFKSELDALGVKVNELDKRVAVLEDGVGGWKFRGIFKFDAKFANEDGSGFNHNSSGSENEFTKERFRLFVTKTIDENTYFYAQYRTGESGAPGSGRGDMNHMRWSHLYLDTKLGWDIGLRVGRFGVDFEDQYGLYTDNDALFGDFRVDGFQLKKSFGILNATAVIGRNFEGVGHEAIADPDDVPTYTEDHMAYILDLSLQPSERFFVGATAYWGDLDNGGPDYEANIYGIYAGFGITPNVMLKGIYYFQDLEVGALPSNLIDDSPNAWKAILDIKQEALKFTSLWVEYSQIENSFLSSAYPRYSIGNTDAHLMFNRPLDPDSKTKVLFVKAEQKWGEKWSTWLRYGHADFGVNHLDDAQEYGIGVTYQYTPAIQFELAYDYVDYGEGNTTTYPSWVAGNLYSPRNGDESVIRFRTTVSF